MAKNNQQPVLKNEGRGIAKAMPLQIVLVKIYSISQDLH